MNAGGGWSAKLDERDLIPDRPVSEPEKDTLVRLETESGYRYGLWCTPEVAEQYRRKFRAAWDQGVIVGGYVESADVTIRSDSIVAVLVPPGVGGWGDATPA